MTNYERAVRFESPDSIPMIFAINRASYDYYDHGDLADLMADHKYLKRIGECCGQLRFV